MLERLFFGTMGGAMVIMSGTILFDAAYKSRRDRLRDQVLVEISAAGLDEEKTIEMQRLAYNMGTIKGLKLVRAELQKLIK